MYVLGRGLVFTHPRYAWRIVKSEQGTREFIKTQKKYIEDGSLLVILRTEITGHREVVIPRGMATWSITPENKHCFPSWNINTTKQEAYRCLRAQRCKK